MGGGSLPSYLKSVRAEELPQQGSEVESDPGRGPRGRGGSASLTCDWCGLLLLLLLWLLLVILLLILPLLVVDVPGLVVVPDHCEVLQKLAHPLASSLGPAGDCLREGKREVALGGVPLGPPFPPVPPSEHRAQGITAVSRACIFGLQGLSP